MDENRLNEVWNQIISSEENSLEKNASKDIDYDALIEELEKTASEEKPKKKNITKDVLTGAGIGASIGGTLGAGRVLQVNKQKDRKMNTYLPFGTAVTGTVGGLAGAGIGAFKAMKKTASESDIDEFNQKAIKGEMTMESDSEAKQRLKEIALQGIKGGRKDPRYSTLMQLLGKKITKVASTDNLVELLSDRLVAVILGGDSIG